MVDILHRVGASRRSTTSTERWQHPRASPAGGRPTRPARARSAARWSFRFGDVGGFDMEVLELDPSGHVRWRVTDGPEEWIGTEIDWRLDQRDEYTIVLFKHEGWREPVEFMHHCSTKWATFLMSLKELVETGRGRPAPDDVQISDWH